MKRLFTEHPASVGETYFAHMGQALSFAGPLFMASLACLVHAAFPFLCVKTGSRAVTHLHQRMVTQRDRRAAPAPQQATLAAKDA
ncbi:DUF6356 family protein [Aquibaculum sediminis]|uniref:DUF6356 family protein n=1 Tax=Aquibaculum sediminis TaxID=3231907 RepID=UPI0034534DD1